MKPIAKTSVLAVLVSAALFSAWILMTNPPERALDRRITTIALSRTGRWLAAATGEGTIAVWDRASRISPVRIDFRHGRLNDLQFSPDERLLVMAGRNLGLCATERPVGVRFLRADQENYGSIRFSQSGQVVLVTTGQGLIETIDVQSGASVVRICCSSIYGDASFTPDGRAIANAGHWPALWDAQSGLLVGRFTASRQFHAFGPIAFDPGGGTILMGSQDGRVHVWDVKTRQLVAMSVPQASYVDALTVSPTGWVIYARAGQVLHLWNPETGQRRNVPDALPTSNLIVGLDGTSLFFGTADGGIELWNISTGDRNGVLRVPWI